MAQRAVDEVVEKVRQLTDELDKMKDPARKERRQFAVHIADVVYERVLCLSLGHESYSWYPWAAPVQTASHSFLPRVGKNGAEISNVALDALYLMADDPEQEMIPIRLSSKTSSPIDKRVSLKRQVLQLLTPYSSCRPAIGASVVFPLLDPNIDMRLLDKTIGLGDIPFFSDLIQLVLDNAFNNITRDVVEQFHAKYPRTVEAKLKVKLYYNRGDLRAYVSDTCLARAVSGAIVNALIRPRRLALRKKLRVARYGPWPAEKGNRLERSVTVAHGQRLLLILGDVSSFTGSCSSSWALLLAATQMLERNPKLRHLLQPIVFVIDNVPFECEPHIAFRVYLYYATMMPVLDTTTNEVFVSAGGMLGVNGNINLTLLAFSIVLMDLQETLEVTHNITCKSQLGGDDFYMELIGHDLDGAATRIRTTIENEVGHLKEFYVYEVSELDQDVTLNAQFCKRSIQVSTSSTRTTFTATIMTQAAVPILADLLAQKRCTTSDRANKEYTKFLFSIHDSLKEFDCRSDLMDILSGVYLELQPKPSKVNVATKRFDPLIDGVYDRFGHFTSSTLEKKCSLVPSVLSSSGFSYRASKSQQLRYLLVRKKAVVRKSFLSDSLSKPLRITILASQLKNCKELPAPGMMLPSPTCFGGRELIAEIKRARAAIKAWRNIGV